MAQSSFSNGSVARESSKESKCKKMDIVIEEIDKRRLSKVKIYKVTLIRHWAVQSFNSYYIQSIPKKPAKQSNRW